MASTFQFSMATQKAVPVQQFRSKTRSFVPPRHKFGLRAASMRVTAVASDADEVALLEKMLKMARERKEKEAAPVAPGASLSRTDAAENLGAPHAVLVKDNARRVPVHETRERRHVWKVLEKWPPHLAPAEGVQSVLRVGREVHPTWVLVQESRDGRYHQLATTRESNRILEWLRLEEELGYLGRLLHQRQSADET